MELWRDIVGYEGLYMVSSLGRIKTLYRKDRDKSETSAEKFLKPFLTKEGYPRVGLNKNGSRKKFLVHRLVATAFVANKANYLEVNHKDANKQNNSAENLEWVTREQNIAHSFANNLVYRDKGTERYNHKLNEQKVREMRALFALGKHRISEIARMYDVNRKTAECAINRVTWKHVD